MPCRVELGSDYQQRALEVHLLLREVNGKRHNPLDYRQLDYDSFGFDPSNYEKDTQKLCGWCKAHPERISKMSRRLQAWWLLHQEMDEIHDKENRR